jgi:iron(III) transport system ATP-binding protein
VTHDQAEALAISDRIAVMEGGRLAQVGRASDVYRRPATRFVADFVGEANLLPVEVEPGGASGARVRLGPLAVVVPGAAPPGPATLVVRPEAIEIRAAPAAGGGGLPGSIRSAAYLGAAGEYVVQTALGPVAVTDPVMADDLLAPGTAVELTFRPRGLALVPGAPADLVMQGEVPA